MNKVPIEESQCFRGKIQVVSWKGKKEQSRKGCSLGFFYNEKELSQILTHSGACYNGFS